MIIYISGKITGDKNYKEKFEKTEEKIKKECEKADVINPVKIFENATFLDYKKIIKICLMLIDESDAIYMLKDWQESKGACIEYGYAFAKDKIILK